MEEANDETANVSNITKVVTLNVQRIYRTKYSRTDQMRFVEDSLKSGPSEICGRQPLKNLK